VCIRATEKEYRRKEEGKGEFIKKNRKSNEH
jgi:hypothetical protein